MPQASTEPVQPPADDHVDAVTMPCSRFSGRNGWESRGDCGGPRRCREALASTRSWTVTATGCTGHVACHRLSPAPKCPWRRFSPRADPPALPI